MQERGGTVRPDGLRRITAGFEDEVTEVETVAERVQPKPIPGSDSRSRPGRGEDIWDAPATAAGVRGFGPTNPFAASSASDSMPGAVRADDELDGRFRLIRRIGTGGMSEVWEAIHTVLGRPLAVKVVTLGANMTASSRLLREAKTIARIEHENVIEIVDFGRTPLGAPFLVMELLRGEPLDALLEREGGLAWPRAKALALQVVSALVAAHGAGVLHRDVKPGNVFVRNTVNGERTKLLDFGISRVHSLSPEETAVTHVDELLGTPAFMSPEQIHGKSADVRSDVYALGCLLFAMLTGHGPFDASTTAETLYRQLYEEAPSLRTSPRGAEIPASLAAIIARCLRKDPELRFPTMLDLHVALEAASPTAGMTIVPDEALPEPAPELRDRYRTLPTVAAVPAPVPAAHSTAAGHSLKSNNALVAGLMGAVVAVTVGGAAYILAPRLLNTRSTASAQQPAESISPSTPERADTSTQTKPAPAEAAPAEAARVAKPAPVPTAPATTRPVPVLPAPVPDAAARPTTAPPPEADDQTPPPERPVSRRRPRPPSRSKAPGPEPTSKPPPAPPKPSEPASTTSDRKKSADLRDPWD